MVSPDDQKTIRSLFEKGVPKNRIARIMQLDTKTVRKILKHGIFDIPKNRVDKIHLDEQLLRNLYADCNGFVQRVYERLVEEHGIEASYSTVLRLIHEYNIGTKDKPRSERIPDAPGEEMQHDCSTHEVTIGGKKHKLICSGLYIRYSKMRYIKYYRRFNRFTMKCFMDEALRFFGYAAHNCIIDNTSLVIDYGSGSHAVFSSEMVAFSRPYGFQWYAHAIGHANRKAGKEKNFRTVETNFLPGRTFCSLTDLNTQAFEWATKRYAMRPQSKTGLIPSELFESEKASLRKLPEFIHPPCQEHKRLLDQYGYISFEGNFYWIPKTQATILKVIEYAKHIDVYDTNRKKLITHYLYDELTKKQIREPEYEQGKKRRYAKPKYIKHDSKEEERILREDGTVVNNYIDFVKSKESGIPHRHRYIRRLYMLRKKTTPWMFTSALKRALEYKVNDMNQLTNIFSTILRQRLYETPSSQVPSDYKQRDAYIQGRFTHENNSKEE
ncbi:MAG: helix-turn-helix domain-containing protein [Chitinispirillia bacterium]|jgi:hypothetical protein